MMDDLKKVLASQGLAPINKHIINFEGECISVPCYHFKHKILSILHNHELMQEENSIENFDIFLVAPNISLKDHKCVETSIQGMYITWRGGGTVWVTKTSHSFL